jgi:cupin superfamily protein
VIGARGMRSPLATWFAGPAALARFRRARLGRTPVVLRPRDATWRALAPGFDEAIAMATGGLPFQIAEARRYDRRGDPRRLAPALRRGATIFVPQVHQVLPRLTRLMVALRVALLGPHREECSFLFAVEGRGRTGMGLHHDGDVDAFWLQLEGRRTVTFGPPVRRGTPADLPASAARTGGWTTVALGPGTLFHLPPWTPHDVVCHGRSLALSLTWRRAARSTRSASATSRARALAAWDVASGRVDAIPPVSRTRLFTQVPVMVDRRGVLTAEGFVALPAAARAFARQLALMPSFPAAVSPAAHATVAALGARGIVAPHDLPLRILPDRPRRLDGWKFA